MIGQTLVRHTDYSEVFHDFLQFLLPACCVKVFLRLLHYIPCLPIILTFPLCKAEQLAALLD